MKISVTAEDIRNGEKFKCRTCPVALAVTRAVQPVAPAEVMVGAYAAILWNNAANREFWQADLPQDARDFVFDFDDGKGVQPFDFDLEIPDA